MTTTTTYLSDLSRVRVAFTGLDADADYARVERSTDGITWTTVRGGDRVGLSATAGKVDDYEFVAGVLNTYRVTAVDAAPVSPNGAGTFVWANNATLNPPLPAGVVNGAQMLLFVTHANTAATITTPTGWTLLAGTGTSHMAVFYRVMAGGVTAPSVAFSGGSAGDSCSAQIRAWTNADVPVYAAIQTNASAQNVNYPGASLPQDGIAWIIHQWKKSTGTSVSTPSLFGDPQGGYNTAGANNESQFTWRTDATVNIQTVLAGTSTWGGGVAAVSKARLLRLTSRPDVGVETSTITPTLTSAWLKNPSRPSLNTAVTISDIGDISRKARSGTFDVIGRTMPVVISDVMSSRELSLTLMVAGVDQANELDDRLAAGDPIFLQAPTGNAAVPTLYASVTGYSIRKTSMRGVRRFFDLALIEVATPASTVYGDTYTYADVIADFASYNAVIAGVATYFQLMDLISTASVIVP